jgi:hypothetical protein
MTTFRLHMTLFALTMALGGMMAGAPFQNLSTETHPEIRGVVLDPRTAQSTRAFDVASVRLSRNQLPEKGSTGNPPALRGKQGKIYYTHVLLIGVIARAYNVRPGEVTGPSWLRSTFYDITATAPQGAAEQVREMLQSLLAERFWMRVHWDAREEQGYAPHLSKLDSGGRL